MNRQQLIEDNMKLVYFIVSREYPTYIHDEDIVQSGMLGLCKAANTWKEEGVFSTYAGKCIKNEIKSEFIRRKPENKVLSLDDTVGEETTLGELIAGDDDIGYLDDDTFFDQLSSEEREVLKLNNIGYSNDEIVQMKDYSLQKVQKILRTIRIKWRNFYGN